MLKKQCQETPFGSIEVKVPQSSKLMSTFREIMSTQDPLSRATPLLLLRRKEESCPNFNALIKNSIFPFLTFYKTL